MPFTAIFTLLPLAFITALSQAHIAFSFSQTSSSVCVGPDVGTATNFTLAAWNTTLPNANATGVPLVLGPAGVAALTTLTSFPEAGSIPFYTLRNGGMTASSDFCPSCVGINVILSGDLGFVGPTSEPPAQIYCIRPDTDPAGGSLFAELAVHNDTHSFSLCTARFASGPFDRVIWKLEATAHNDGSYDFESCYPVVLHVVGSD